MEPLGTSQNLIELFRTSQNVLEPHGTLWNLMEPHGTFWKLVVPCGTLWYLVVPCGTKATYGTLRDIMERYETSWNQPFWNPMAPLENTQYNPKEAYRRCLNLVEPPRILWIIRNVPEPSRTLQDHFSTFQILTEALRTLCNLAEIFRTLQILLVPSGTF